MAGGPGDRVRTRGAFTSLIPIGEFALVWFVRECVYRGGDIVFSALSVCQGPEIRFGRWSKTKRAKRGDPSPHANIIKPYKAFPDILHIVHNRLVLPPPLPPTASSTIFSDLALAFEGSCPFAAQNENGFFCFFPDIFETDTMPWLYNN